MCIFHKIVFVQSFFLSEEKSKLEIMDAPLTSKAKRFLATEKGKEYIREYHKGNHENTFEFEGATVRIVGLDEYFNSKRVSVEMEARDYPSMIDLDHIESKVEEIRSRYQTLKTGIV